MAGQIKTSDRMVLNEIGSFPFEFIKSLKHAPRDVTQPTWNNPYYTGPGMNYYPGPVATSTDNWYNENPEIKMDEPAFNDALPNEGIEESSSSFVADVKRAIQAAKDRLTSFIPNTIDSIKNRAAMTAAQWAAGPEGDNMHPNHNDIKTVSLRFGECPVINPPWQFNELDDVRSNPLFPMMGRVYLESIMTNYPIMTVEPGREQYCKDPLKFFGVDLFAGQANSYIKNNGKESLGAALIKPLTSALNLIGNTMSFLWDTITNADPDRDRFLRFKPGMKMFHEYCNDIFREVAANMNLLMFTGKDLENATASMEAYTVQESFNSAEAELTARNQKVKEEYEAIQNGTTSLGHSLKTTAQKIASGFGQKRPESYYESFKTLASEAAEGATQLWESIMQPYLGTMGDLNLLHMLPTSSKLTGSAPNFAVDNIDKQYMPFLIKKTSISESFSNTTSPHPLGAQLNAQAEEMAANNAFGPLGNMGASLAMGGGLQGVMDELKNAGKVAIGEVTKNVAEMGQLMNGSGRALFPEIWSNSSYSRSYSIEIDLFSPPGDKISIFENVYLPYLIWFCLSSPLQSGRNYYTSPFLVRLYAKGLFSVEFGMVESLQVTRGEDKNNRTVDGLPKTIKLQIGVKDLTPVMMLSQSGGSFWKLKKANGGLTEYLAVISGLSIADRKNIARRFKSYFAQTWAKLVGQTFDSDTILFRASQSFLLRPIMSWKGSAVTTDVGNGVMMTR